MYGNRMFFLRILVAAWVIIIFSLSACSEDDAQITTGSTDGDIEDVGEREADSEMLCCECPSETEDEGGILPDSLPFEFTREDSGDVPTEEEISQFTKKFTGFLKDVGYFDWLWRTGHGLDASYDPDKLHYKFYWQDTKAIKEGNTVKFVHYGGADNIMLRTAKLMIDVGSFYMLSGNDLAARLSEEYSNAITASFVAMLFSQIDPVKYITARAIFNHNHSYELDGGRMVEVDYDPVKQEQYSWNAHTIPNPRNPEWGDIWVRNMRSKDDVPYMFHAYHYLLRIAKYANDDGLKESAKRAAEYLHGFAKDIVDSGYFIRTKESDGKPYIPTEEDHPSIPKDLASFVNFEDLIPNAECNPKLASALMAYGEPLGNDCGNGISPTYETAATNIHYFNYAIIRHFHIAAIEMAILTNHLDMAKKLMEGLAQRVDTDLHDDEHRAEHSRWDSELAPFMLSAAAVGLPLTSEEVRLIWQVYSDGIDHYKEWPNWDLWSSSVPDGEQPWTPDDEGHFIRPEDLVRIFEFCYSPLRNPTSQMPIDCSVLADPSKWGE